MNDTPLQQQEKRPAASRAITVFGGSVPRPGEPAYQQALRLGTLLGGRGWEVLTGGYIGTMEAVSRGVAEAGGRVVGVTSDEIERWRAVGPNRWVQEERRHRTSRERLFALARDCDAALALPGGIGTLCEIAFMWSLLQTGSIPPRPLVLIGPAWAATLRTFLAELGEYVAEADRPLLTYAPDADAAFERLLELLGDHHTYSRRPD